MWTPHHHLIITPRRHLLPSLPFLPPSSSLEPAPSPSCLSLNHRQVPMHISVFTGRRSEQVLPWILQALPLASVSLHVTHVAESRCPLRTITVEGLRLRQQDFADKVTEVINPEEDYVWIHDYHLMILPTILRRRFHRVKLGFFLHSRFPSSEIYRTIPVRDDILRALLSCDLVGFHTFDYARHLLSYCSRMLGLDYESKRSYIGLDYYGRTVTIKILPVGIHMGQLQSLLSLSKTGDRIKELKKQYEGKIVILGVDDMDMFKGLSLKLLAMGQLLEVHEDLRGKVVLVQILGRREGEEAGGGGDLGDWVHVPFWFAEREGRGRRRREGRRRVGVMMRW